MSYSTHCILLLSSYRTLNDTLHHLCPSATRLAADFIGGLLHDNPVIRSRRFATALAHPWFATCEPDGMIVPSAIYMPLGAFEASTSDSDVIHPQAAEGIETITGESTIICGS